MMEDTIIFNPWVFEKSERAVGNIRQATDSERLEGLRNLQVQIAPELERGESYIVPHEFWERVRDLPPEAQANTIRMLMGKGPCVNQPKRRAIGGLTTISKEPRSDD